MVRFGGRKRDNIANDDVIAYAVFNKLTKPEYISMDAILHEIDDELTGFNPISGMGQIGRIPLNKDRERILFNRICKMMREAGIKLTD